MNWVKAIQIDQGVPEGLSAPDAVGLVWPMITTLRLHVARETTIGYARGTYDLSAVDANQHSTSIAADWTKLTDVSAEVHFRVFFKTFTDLAVINIHKTPEGDLVDITYTSFDGKIVYGSRPTIHLPAGAVKLWPVAQVPQDSV